MSQVTLGRRRGNRSDTMDYRLRATQEVGNVTIQTNRRWEGRLTRLGALRTASDTAASAWTIARVRQILMALEDEGADLSTVRLFLGDEGAVELQRHIGERYVTLEVLEGDIELHDVDVASGTSTSLRVGQWRAAAEAFATA